MEIPEEIGKEKAKQLVKDRGNTGPRQGQEKAVGKTKEKEKEKARKEIKEVKEIEKVKEIEEIEGRKEWKEICLV